MRRSMLLGLAAAAAFCCVAQAKLTDFVNQLPACGLGCIAQEIPKSACQTFDNDTCICNDAGLKAQIQVCLLEKCTRLETLDVARIEAKACDRPVRRRKVDILAPLAIQIPGFLAVPVRLFTRWSTMHRFAPDDWIMLFTGVLFVVFVVLGHVAGAAAFGEDVWMVTPEELTFGLKVFYVDESFYLICLGLTKISVLFFYLRIFPNKTFRWTTYATMGFIILSTTILLFMQIFQCIPFEYNWVGWKGDFGPHQCLNINTLAFVAGGLSISHDVIILILPLPLLYKLNMTRRKKAGIFVMFSLGVFILITSCVRLQYIVLFTRSLNPTWDFTDALVWSGVEVSVSMVVVCLPAVRTLMLRVLPNLFGSKSATEITPPHKASDSSGFRSIDSNNKYRNRADYDEERRAVAAAAKLVEKRRKFFSFVPKGEPNESELELGDKIRGDVRTQIRHEDEEEALGRRSTESGIHVSTTTTFEDPLGRRQREARDEASFGENP